jgi:ribose transport system substrate-binding protein
MRDPWKTAVLLAATAVAALALSGCAQNGNAGQASAGGSYIFLPKSLDNPYWADARKGMESEAKKLGVPAEFLGPPQDDAAAQVAIFESALAKKPLGIAVSPNDPGSVMDVISRARAAGIPVIAWDGPVPGSQVQGYIGTDNVAAGGRAGDALAQAVGDKGKVAVVIGSLSAPNLKQRLTGLLAALAKHPAIKVVATEESGESIATAQNKAETILQANPDLAGMAGIGGSDLPGITGALKAANRCGTVKAVGFDVVAQGIDAMRGGCVQALVSQKPFGMTAQALQLLVDMHKGTSKQPNGFTIDTGVVVVQPAGLSAYLAAAPH